MAQTPNDAEIFGLPDSDKEKLRSNLTKLKAHHDYTMSVLREVLEKDEHFAEHVKGLNDEQLKNLFKKSQKQ